MSPDDAALARARLDLAQAVAADAAAPSAAARWAAARLVLRRYGAAALGVDPATAPGLAELIAQAAGVPAGPARRIFAVLVVDALATPGLLPAHGSQARLDRAIFALLESALTAPLLRAGYPFRGDLDAKRRSLAALPSTIDEVLRPPEPSIPTWLSGRVGR